MSFPLSYCLGHVKVSCIVFPCIQCHHGCPAVLSRFMWRPHRACALHVHSPDDIPSGLGVQQRICNVLSKQPGVVLIRCPSENSICSLPIARVRWLSKPSASLLQHCCAGADTPMASVGWGVMMEATLVRLGGEPAVMKTLLWKWRRELSVDQQFRALAPTLAAHAALSGSASPSLPRGRNSTHAATCTEGLRVDSHCILRSCPKSTCAIY